jgi:hypothetical protein
MDPCPVGERGVVLGILRYILLGLRQNPGKISPGTYFCRLCLPQPNLERLRRNLDPSTAEIVEMHGNAGDVYVMDMRVVHSPSINARNKARMMLTCRFLCKRFDTPSDLLDR